jgi:T4 bacteriophage base plate protein
MRAVSAVELLEVWEVGQSRSPLDRAILLLLMAYPEFSTAMANALPLSQKDVLLLQLREQLFGDQLESIVTCPACNTALEFSLTGHDLGVEDYSPPPDTVTVTVDTYTLVIRFPTIADIREAAGQGHRMFDHIIVQATHDDAPVAPEQLPDMVRAMVAERLQDLDPLCDIRLAVPCPACHVTWQAPFDVTSFLWQEIDHWARRTLYTVHRLAFAYSWPERDILDMSAWRRQHYLELLNA